MPVNTGRVLTGRKIGWNRVQWCRLWPSRRAQRLRHGLPFAVFAISYQNIFPPL